MKTLRFRIRALIGAALMLALAENAIAQPERPLVFIPGILGCTLSQPDGRVVWGDRNSLLNFEELEIGPNGPVKALHANGLVEKINVLGPFWPSHKYDGLLDTLHKLGYVEGQTLFLFPYDWRLSNFDTARTLASVVDRTPALKNNKFDIVAHSMGGIVAKIWMLEYGGANKVHKAIFLGTPFQGSMNSFATLSNGWGGFANVIAGGSTRYGA
jgi:pimeloyl-ACP methyl ester carboxylesterase